MAHTNIHDPLHVYSIRELPLTQLPVDNTIDTLQLVMVISTVQMLHEILQLFYIINCILIRPNKQIAANSSYLQVVFFCVQKFALIFI